MPKYRTSKEDLDLQRKTKLVVPDLQKESHLENYVNICNLYIHYLVGLRRYNAPIKMCNNVVLEMYDVARNYNIKKKEIKHAVFSLPA